MRDYLRHVPDFVKVLITMFMVGSVFLACTSNWVSDLITENDKLPRVCHLIVALLSFAMIIITMIATMMYLS